MLLDVGWWSLGQKSGVDKVHRKGEGVSSGELLGGLVQAIHYGVHGRHCLDNVIKGLVPERNIFNSYEK